MYAGRSIGAVLTIALSLGAWAARADLAASGAWFSQKSLEQRTLLQAELILNGEFRGLADGTFGGATYQAIVSHQMHRGIPADGVLTADQEADLLQRAARSYNLLGLRVEKDAATGISLPLPMGLLMAREASEWGTTWTAGTDKGLAVTLQAVPEMELALNGLFAGLTEGPERRVLGADLQADRFRVAGSLGNTRDYFAGFVFKDGVSRGVIVSWLPRLELLGPMAGTYLVSMMLSPSIGSADAVLAAAAARLPSPVQPAPAAPGATPPVLGGPSGAGAPVGTPPSAGPR